MNETGGLSASMPLTAITALVGCMSIIGFPFFSGFTGKFMIYEVSVASGITLPIYIIYGLFAIFLSVVTMAYCVKFYSSVFLGTSPQKLKGIEKKDVPLEMQIPQVILALFCVLLGLFPMVSISYIYSAIAESNVSGILPATEAMFGKGSSIIVNDKVIGSFNPIILLLIFVVCILIAYLVFKSAGAKKRVVGIWYCGEEFETDEVRFRSQGFFLPIISLVEGLFYTSAKEKAECAGEKTMFNALDADKHIYKPLVSCVLDCAGFLKKLHNGLIQMYVFWQVLAAIIILVALLFLVR